MSDLETAPPYKNAKDYFLISDVDDRETLPDLVLVTCQALPSPKRRLKSLA